mmetsp:Transcript_33553/g.47674  ORF Transcript_33553/g.47674 Transcript_33553/m.47674 type:complete len:294 (-) Transcript_33553:58-939(-)
MSNTTAKMSSYVEGTFTSVVFTRKLQDLFFRNQTNSNKTDPSAETLASTGATTRRGYRRSSVRRRSSALEKITPAPVSDYSSCYGTATSAPPTATTTTRGRTRTSFVFSQESESFEAAVQTIFGPKRSLSPRRRGAPTKDGTNLGNKTTSSANSSPQGQRHRMRTLAVDSWDAKCILRRKDSNDDDRSVTSCKSSSSAPTSRQDRRRRQEEEGGAKARYFINGYQRQYSRKTNEELASIEGLVNKFDLSDLLENSTSFLHDETEQTSPPDDDIDDDNEDSLGGLLVGFTSREA